MPDLVLVDTSVWVAHLRESSTRLADLLEEDRVLIHDFVVGELACGNLKNRLEIISLMQALPKAPVLEHNEVLDFIERRNLMGQGLGWVDVHLLGAALLTDAPLWTLDRRLKAAAEGLGVGF